jgi:hypothetical protein
MIELKGYKEILNVVQKLPSEFSDPYLRRVHKKAVVPLENEIHRRAPVGLTGNLADSIGTVKAEGLGGVATGPIIGNGRKGFSGHLNEYGTKSRRTRRGANRGRQPAKPFERPAWEAKEGQVEQGIATILTKDLGQFIRRTL